MSVADRRLVKLASSLNSLDAVAKQLSGKPSSSIQLEGFPESIRLRGARRWVINKWHEDGLSGFCRLKCSLWRLQHKRRAFPTPATVTATFSTAVQFEKYPATAMANSFATRSASQVLPCHCTLGTTAIRPRRSDAASKPDHLADNWNLAPIPRARCADQRLICS
jgi:hypothetical protein